METYYNAQSCAAAAPDCGTIFSLSWHHYTMRCYSIVTQYDLEKILLFDLAFLSLLCMDCAMESCRPCPFVYIYSPGVDFSRSSEKAHTVLELLGAKVMVQKMCCFDKVFKMHFQTLSFIKGNEMLLLPFKHTS